VSTCYRVVRAAGESREGRAQAAHPARVKPELMAAGPDQVHSWDITKLQGPAKWTYYHLHVILDIFSRYAVGWMVATRESAVLAEKLIAATCAKQRISPGQLTIHAERGSSMTSKPVALLLAGLGVTQSHSRPHVSNDNPYSEAQFKTLKYRPGFPRRFASIEAARAHCQDFFGWHNNQHRHGGPGLHTAADVHHGRAAAIQAARAHVLDGAYPAASMLGATGEIAQAIGEGLSQRGFATTVIPLKTSVTSNAMTRSSSAALSTLTTGWPQGSSEEVQPAEADRLAGGHGRLHAVGGHRERLGSTLIAGRALLRTRSRLVMVRVRSTGLTCRRSSSRSATPAS
jgi:putative transposase